MNKIVKHKNLIIKIFGIIVTIISIPLYLAAAFALQGIGGNVSFFWESLYSLNAVAGIIAVPLMLIGYIENYKFNWINYALFVPIALNVLIAFSILVTTLRGTYYIPIVLAIPVIIYMIAWWVHKNSKPAQDL